MLISFEYLLNKFKIKPKGVLHIGSNTAIPECKSYYENGVEKTCWIEALPDIFEEMKQVVSEYPNSIPIKACISDRDNKEVEFNVSSNHGESSSVFEFSTHLVDHPEVKFIDKIKLKTSRVDSIFRERKLSIKDYPFINLDLQGSELIALKSMGLLLASVEYVYVEVNTKEVYKGCPMEHEIIDYLSKFDFVQVEKRMTGAGWGDAFFIKRKQEVISPDLVPLHFRKPHPFPYPDYNKEIFEEWFNRTYDFKRDATERVYLNVFWTGYFVTHQFGENKYAVDKLQIFIDLLDRKKKYYTIVQFDLGCMVDFKDLDIIVCAMSGNRVDYPLPLLTMPHYHRYTTERDIFCSFIGRKTHGIRDVLFGLYYMSLRHLGGYYMTDAKTPTGDYTKILSRSTFVLCPRGFGLNSFRISESIESGAIPVYISDDFIFGHNADFEEYGVVVHESNINNLHEILSAITPEEIKSKQDKLAQVFRTYYSYDGAKKLLLNYVKNN